MTSKMNGAISVGSSMNAVMRSLNQSGLSWSMGYTRPRSSFNVKRRSMKSRFPIPRSFRPSLVVNVEERKEKNLRKN